MDYSDLIVWIETSFAPLNRTYLIKRGTSDRINAVSEALAYWRKFKATLLTQFKSSEEIFHTTNDAVIISINLSEVHSH